jgi:hypothetical protein
MRLKQAMTPSEEEKVHSTKRTFLSGMFGYSSDENETDYTFRSGRSGETGASVFSSDYNTDSNSDSDSDSDDDDDDSTVGELDRQLRVRHTQACKYMRVSSEISILILVDIRPASNQLFMYATEWRLQKRS